MGQFRFRGRLVSLLEVGTGFHPDLSGRENIILNAKINGMSSKAIRQIYDDIVDFSELGPQIDTPIKRYSSGMYMRLAFSVAAHLESEILIVDEVLAVGDAGFQKKCLDKMLEISGRGRTLLFVSHDMNAISSLCTKALELSHGRIADSARPKNAIQNQEPVPADNDVERGLRSVNHAISEYVLDGGLNSECVWVTSQAPAMLSGAVVLQRIALLDAQGKLKKIFDVSESIEVTIEFDVFKSSNR
jgi:lipopolysaccharide transport system ATP-binding protein